MTRFSRCKVYILFVLIHRCRQVYIRTQLALILGLDDLLYVKQTTTLTWFSRCKAYTPSSSAVYRSRQDVSDHDQGWWGHCVNFDLWPQKLLSSTVSNLEGPLLQPSMLLCVSAPEEGPEIFSVSSWGELQPSLCEVSLLSMSQWKLFPIHCQSSGPVLR